MNIYQAIRTIDSRVNFYGGSPVLALEFYDDYNKEHKIGVFLPKSFIDRLTSRGANLYEAKAKQYGDMFILVIEKGTYNESYTIINNKVVDHETFNPNHFIEFKHYTTLKQDYLREI